MKFLSTLVLASTAFAYPTIPQEETKRQLGGTVGSTANEFKTGGCNDIIFVWARGSTEIGNMVGLPEFLHPNCRISVTLMLKLSFL